MPKPRARYKAMVAVIRNVMWLWGGIVEISDVEIALDDMWRVDLSKSDAWECVKDNSGGEGLFVVGDNEVDDDGDDDRDDDDDNDDDDDEDDYEWALLKSLKFFENVRFKALNCNMLDLLALW